MYTQLKSLIPRSAARQVKIARTRLFEAAGSNRYTWPALNDLDRQMVARLDGAPGVFLEIGGNDGYSQSNTYHLERVLGWRGILVEPIPSLHRTCCRVRPRSQCFNVACVGPDGPEFVEMEDRNLMSVALGLQDPDEEAVRLAGRRRLFVPATTLSDVIDQAGEPRIDFMSIDVEGVEMVVLSGLDLERHTPRFMLVETAHPERVEALLDGAMKAVARLSHHDHLYERVW